MQVNAGFSRQHDGMVCLMTINGDAEATVLAALPPAKARILGKLLVSMADLLERQAQATPVEPLVAYE